MTSKCGVFAAAWILLTGPGIAAAQEWPEPSIADIVYAVVDERELALDLYLPEGVANPPLLVWIHGGAWPRRPAEES